MRVFSNLKQNYANALSKPFNPRNARVLIVDDSSADTVMATRALQKLGVRRIHAVHSAESAIIELSHKHYQAALVDINLPGSNGLELLKAIREAYPSIKVIMVTGARDQQVAIAAMKCGASDYVTKDDFVTSGILNSVSSVLSGIEDEQAAWLQAGASFDAAISEVNYMLDTQRVTRDFDSTSSLQSDDYFWNDARRLTVEYIRAYLEVFPHRPQAEEDRLLASLFDHGASPRDTILLYSEALEAISEEEDAKTAHLAASPTLLLAVLLERLVEEYQQSLSMASMQAQAKPTGPG